MNIALIGPSGSGKGTHVGDLCGRYHLQLISSGELLRQHLARASDLGRRAQHYMDRHEMVPDELVDTMIAEDVRAIPADFGTLFDGFPRTAYQAAYLSELLGSAGRQLDAAILLPVSDDEVVARLSGRLVCRQCHTPFHATLNPPRVADTCDVCGGPLDPRADDAEPLVRRRLRIYHQATAPLLDIFARQEKLCIVAADGPIEAVHARLVAALDAVRDGHGPFVSRDAAAQIYAPEVARGPGAAGNGGLDIVLLGGPGSGKGTQADRLCTQFNVPHIATGDLFRDNLKNETDLGKLAKSYMDRGELVPDEVAEAMVEERLARADTAGGFVLDGFPRTVPQAHSLDDMLSHMGRRIAGVLYINVSDDAIVGRLSGRVVCRNCQTPYHLQFNPPRTAGVCDKCGGPLYQRDDDNPTTVRARLKTFHGQTEPLIDYYSQAALLHEIDGEGDVAAVTDRSVDMAGRLARVL